MLESAMPRERDLQLNSLSRYRKRSDQFTLEVHSHCEVPAGCGGVVLRWINPRQTVPFLMRIYAPGPAEVFLDGTMPVSGTSLLSIGNHVVAIHLTQANLEQGLLMFAAFSTRERMGVTRQGPPVRELSVLSRADGSWRYTATQPVDDWRLPEFNDAAWQPMIDRPIARPDKKQPGSYQHQLLEETGAHALGLPLDFGTREVWVRKTIVVGESAISC
jgi:hypothetical protein